MAQRGISLRALGKVGSMGDKEILQLLLRPYEKRYQRWLHGRRRWQMAAIITGYILLAAGMGISGIFLYNYLDDPVLQLGVLCGVLIAMLMIAATAWLYAFIRRRCPYSLCDEWRVKRFFRRKCPHIVNFKYPRPLRKFRIYTRFGMIDVDVDSKDSLFYISGQDLIVVRRGDKFCDTWHEVMEIMWIQDSLVNLRRVIEVCLKGQYLVCRHEEHQLVDEVTWSAACEQIRRLSIRQRLSVGQQFLAPVTRDHWLEANPADLRAFWESLHDPENNDHHSMVSGDEVRFTDDEPYVSVHLPRPVSPIV